MSEVPANFVIPHMPEAIAAVFAYMNSVEPEVRKIAAMLTKDPGTSSRVLALANSSLYGVDQSTSDLVVAIGRIGLGTLRQLVLEVSVTEAFRVSPSCQLDSKALLRHMAFVGQLSYKLGQVNHQDSLADLQIAGLLHDVGLLAQATNSADRLNEVLEYCSKNGESLAQAEGMYGLPSHAFMGRLVAKTWNLTPTVQALILNHHNTNYQPSPSMNQKLTDLKNILLLADLMAHRFGAGMPRYQRDTRVDPDLLKKTQIDQATLIAAVKETQCYVGIS